MAGINYSDKIPNNVNLDEDPRLQRARSEEHTSELQSH